ncbi:MAG UNVERIFIED_CONTAM: hypothetical protein LVQ98_09315 [Rickettsiaceae bacterium]
MAQQLPDNVYKALVQSATNEFGRPIDQKSRDEVLREYFSANNINAHDNMGYTALHHAVMACNRSVVVWLLQQGAGTDIPTNHNGPVQQTAMELAANVDKFNLGADMAKLLSDHQAQAQDAVQLGGEGGAAAADDLPE